MIPRSAPFAALTAPLLYDLLRLRCDVFVVEQQCAYPDLDGRDTEPGTTHIWLATDSAETTGTAVAAYLRVLSDPDGSARVGRVVTAAPFRGRGLAGRLLEAAMTVVGDRPSLLDAQTTAVRVYERFGFTVAGPPYLEDGIEHVPMHRPGAVLSKPSGNR